MVKLRVCVTGGAGLIGQPIVRRLVAAGHDVSIMDIKQCSIPGADSIICDLTSYEQVESTVRNFDVVVHLAGSVLDSTRKNPPVAINVSLVGTANLLQSCIKNKIHKVVYASSASIYNGISENAIVDESVISHPFHTELLGTVKMMGERLIYEYAKNWNLQYVVLRIGPVFDASERCTSIICDFIKAGLRKRTFSIWGSGQRLLQPTDVEDVAEGCLLSINSVNKIYNVISPDRYSILQIAQIMKEKFGFDYSLDPDKPDGQTYPYISSKKISEDLKWRHTPLVLALERIVTNYKSILAG